MADLNIDYTHRLLLAEPYLEDENFSRAVVLIMEYSEEGAVGFILNHPIKNRMEEILPDFPVPDFPVFLGGPMEHNTLHFFHVCGEELPGGELIRENLFWGGDFDVLLEKAGSGKISSDQIRFCVGYSGWGKAQLDQEIEAGTWILGPDFQPEILRLDPVMMWRTILRSMGPEYAAVANSPENPSLN